MEKVTDTFIECDGSFRSSLFDAADTDPLSLHSDGIFAELQGKQGSVPIFAVKETAERLDRWQDENPETTAAEGRIMRRDLDKAIGAFAARKEKIFEHVPSLYRPLQRLITPTIPTPRADFYAYTLGAGKQHDTSYSGDVREHNLIDIFTQSIEAAHDALQSTLLARMALRHGNQPAAADALESALESTKEMHRPMVEVYRSVGPDFVANEVTRYLVGIPIGSGYYEGPNPSHSGFMALDRFVLGSFEPMYADKPYFEKHYMFRLSDMPPHLKELMTGANCFEDTQSLVELALIHAPDVTDLAADITKRIRKFKVIHKSYADKGLKAKGGTLSEDEPDLLSDAVQYARTKETLS